MKKRLFALVLAFALLMSTVPAAFAASSEAASAANTLYSLGLFKGVGTLANGSPNFDLDRVPNRMEAVTLLVRLLGKEALAQSSSWRTPFTDVADWAKPYVGYAYVTGATNGISDTAFGSTNPVTATQYLTFVLRALGYESGKDFQWDAAWVLSDKIGLTHGQYSAANNSCFTRGDAAIVSLAALKCKLKSSSQTLADSLGIVVPLNSYDLTQESYLTRKLTDGEIAALRNAAPEELRKKISTVADAYAWLEQFGTYFYSSIGWGEPNLRGLDAIEAIETHRDKNDPMTAAELYTAITGWLLSDDVAGIEIGAAVILKEDSEYEMSPFLCLPMQGGYWVTDPVLTWHSGGYYEINDTFVTSLSQLGSLLTVEDSISPVQILLLDAAKADTTLQFTNYGMKVVSGSARQVYAKSTAQIDGEKAMLLEKWHAESALLTPAQFGLPDPIGKTTMTYPEARALVGQTPAAIAARVKTVGDVMLYLMAARFHAGHDGVFTPWYDCGDLEWAYCAGGDQQIIQNYGCCCGGFANVPSYLLQGDYEKVGILRWLGGGNHTISWVYTGGKYYVFDFVQLCGAGYYRSMDNPTLVLDRLEDFYPQMPEGYCGFRKAEVELMVAFETDSRGGLASSWENGDYPYQLTFPKEYTGKVITIYSANKQAYVDYRPVNGTIPGWND